MASPQSQQNYEPHSFSWYWDDDNDYDLKEVTSKSKQNYRKQSGREQGSLLQTLAYPYTDWGHERQLADSAVVVVHGDSTEYEQRWSESDEFDFGCLSTGELYPPRKPVPKQTRRTVRAEGAHGNRLSPSEPGRHDSTHLELESQRCPCEDSGLTSLDSIIFGSCPQSPIPQLSSPSSSTTSSTKHKPSLTLALTAAAFDESRPHGSSIALPQHSHYHTCEAKADMLFDQRQRRRDKRERTVGREAEVERGATSRFFQFPFRLSLRDSGARASRDMESIWEEDERVVDLGYKSPTREEAVDGDERGRSGQSRSGYTSGGRTSGEHGYRNGYSNGGYSYLNGGRGRAGSGGGGEMTKTMTSVVIAEITLTITSLNISRLLRKRMTRRMRILTRRKVEEIQRCTILSESRTMGSCLVTTKAAAILARAQLLDPVMYVLPISIRPLHRQNPILKRTMFRWQSHIPLL
ncbi:hypothetical protein PM082_017131 [Marasmius tenuissimus]|nr:hypothetical protein PM082_017131 [Marasmius tenuissimus]